MVAVFLILWDSIPVDLIVPNRIGVNSHAVSGVTLNGIDGSILDFFYDAGVIRLSVLSVFIVPIKEDNHAGGRLGGIIHPLSPVLEPLRSKDTTGILGNNPCVNITALIGAPAHKAGAPLDTRAKSIPAPVRFTAIISDL